MKLPDFFVIGAYKCGTTTLHRLLAQHPQIFMARKEPNFFAFSEDYEGGRPVPATAVRTWTHYLRLFEDAPQGALVGEVSPEYLVSPLAATRIREVLPEARLIAILRNPVERAYSDFLMYLRDGVEPCRDFREALDQQDARRKEGLPTGEYIATGFFGRQLLPWFDTFGADRLKVVLLEDLAADPQTTLTHIFGFLGVETMTIADTAPRNPAGVPANSLVRAAYRIRHRLGPLLRPLVPSPVKDRLDALLAHGLERPRIDAATRARLVEIYRDDIRLLGHLIGRDLSHWTQLL